jgi:hypothetical protein
MNLRSAWLLLVASSLVPSLALATVRHVNLNNSSPVLPYTNWATAATNIQDAIDAASPGDQILVTNGVYQTGGRAIGSFDVTNRVALTKAVAITSVNGPAVTVIQGSQASGTNAVRCAYLTNGAALVGFTLTNGASGVGNYMNGGGVSCASASAVVSNCLLIGNYAVGTGGGASRGTLVGCVLTRNQTDGGGGAAAHATLINCTITNNTAYWAAGTLGCTATNCLISRNSATNYGGGSAFSTLVNCTVAANSLQPGYGGGGGGSYHDTLFNCIVYGNTAPNGSNYYSSAMSHCCSAPLPGGGNIASTPLFVSEAGGNLRLQTNSPCINAGNNSYVTGDTDLDGNARIIGGTVDIGAYECQSPALLVCYSWLQNHGLPTDAATVYADADGDRMNNWQEWRAQTNPTNAASLLQVTAPANNVSGLTITWQSVNGVTYFLDRSTNLGAQPAFSTIQSNLAGQASTTSFTDTTATNGGPYFYRVGVQ